MGGPGGLEIRVLGELELVRDGRPVALPASKRTRALLGYLVVGANRQLRERLCELLWEGPDDPRAALRWSLHKLRQLLEGDANRLETDREHVAFRLAGADVDLANVRVAVGADPSTASIDALRAAARRFRGELLEGIDLPDCLRFQAWLVAERESARALRSRILAALPGRLLGDPAESLRWGHERLALEPTEEAAHLQVARALAELGRTREALAQLEACRTVLARELGASPTSRFEQVRHALLATRRSPPEPHPGAGPDPVRVPALVGRAAETALCAARLAAPCPAAVLLEGEPGIGKSRLLAELANLARAAGRRVLTCRSYQAETVRPYGVFIDALRSAPLPELPEHRRADLALLLPELGPPPAAADRHRLFDAVAAAIDGHAPPPVVLIDDIQWVDEVSAALLHYLIRAGGASLFALAARAGELEQNVAASRSVRMLVRDGRLERRSIARLTAEETAALARQIAPALDPALVFEESAGNPLFVLEVARAGGAVDGPGPSLGGLIADRLADLDARSLEIVGVAAALGTGFTIFDLGRAAPAAPAAILDTVEELVRRGIFCVAGEGFDFVHDLLRRGAYQRLSPTRRRLVHHDIARGLLADGLLGGALAHHAALGGDAELAARACIAAGEHAARLFAHADAIALATRGRTLAVELPEPARTRLTVELLRVEVVARLTGNVLPGASNDGHASVVLRAEITRALVAAQAAGLVVEAGSAFRLLAQIAYEEGDSAKTIRYLGAAAETVRTIDAEAAAAQLAMNGRCTVQVEGDLEGARRDLAAAGASAARGGEELGELHWGMALLARWDGDHATARALLERALACFRRDEDRWRECTCVTWLAMLELETGDTAALAARCAELLKLAARMGDGAELPFARALDALGRSSAGDPDAGPRLEEALAALRRVDTKAQLAYILDQAAVLDLQHGRLAEARRRAAEAIENADTVGRRSEAALARALFAEAARRSRARGEAVRALEPVLQLAAIPDRLPVRARRAVIAAARDLGLAIPTLAPTQASTRVP